MSLVIVLLSPVMLVSSDFRSFFSPPPTPPVSSVPPSASARVHHLTSVCYSTISTRQTAGRSHLMTAGGISSLGTRRNDNRSCTCLATSVNFCTIRLLSLLMQNSSLPANHQSYCSDSVKLERHIPLLEKVFGTDVMETYFLSVLIRRDVYSDLAMGESLKLFHRSSRLISPLEEEELISVHITSFSMRSVILLPSSLSRYCCSATTVIATLSYPITVSVQTTATGNPVILINIPVKFKLGSVIFTEATYNQSLPRHPAPNGSPSPLFTDLMPRVSAHKLSPRVILRRQHSFRSRQHTDGGIWVQTLRTIFRKLQNRTVNIETTSCSDGRWNFVVGSEANPPTSNITCDCTFNASSICHVTNIQLKSLSLPGIIPPEFGNLTRLRQIDLTRNFLNGTIPATLSQIPLEILSVTGNRLSGPFPPQLGEITTLADVNLETNSFTGPLPSNLGNLKSLQRLLLSSNNFTGRIPESFSNLTNLTDFRIDGNSLSGKIPDFIGNWTLLERLDLQGTSMEGPIPASISNLKNLKELRITDLRGPASSFPNLQNMTNMERLVLRNCLIRDPIPEYIATSMSNLKLLDLGSNMLNGTIPDTLRSLDKLDFMFLNNNSLTGPVPEFIINSKNNFDLSYNNFTQPPTVSCNELDVNLISSFPSVTDNSVQWCLREDLPCPGDAKQSSLFINCGGNRLKIGKDTYTDDLNSRGQSTFSSVSERWAYSSSGAWLGNEKAGYIATDRFNLINESTQDYYKTARLSPQSLKYYGLCMIGGSYKVQLHFAEIMFSNDQTFNSLGQRIFDIYIQGNLLERDFNIAERAGGVGKPFRLETDVQVNGSTLEIHLKWTGKGTNVIPTRAVYGPLISAITITPNFKVDTGKELSNGAVAGIVIAACAVFVLLVLIILRFTGYLGGKEVNENDELRGLDLQTGVFTLKQIKRATNNFDPVNKIGEGGFGPVYKGVLADGGTIAVKQLSSKSKQGNREFVTEIGMISALQHPNLVKLYGCCIEGKELLLVYEYLENNSLARALFGTEKQRLHLDWSTRNKICLGIAKGLAYLHEESRLKIVHRDIKATNVLLDLSLNAKISDFGLAKLDEGEDTHISTRIAGTIGYMAPEYAMRGYLTDKADVYSFGVVCLEIVSGKSNTNYRPKEEFVYLLDWAYVLQEQGSLLELVDPDLGTSFSKKEAMRMLNIALLCTNPSPTLRPPMSSVVSMLEGKSKVQPPVVKRESDPSGSAAMRFKAFELLSQDSESQVSTFTRNREHVSSSSMDGPWVDSSFSEPSKDLKDEQQEAGRSSSSSKRLLDDLTDVKIE